MTLVCDAEFETDTLRLERRRERRVDQQRPAAVYEPATAHVIQGTTRNISATGLQIAFDGGTSVRPGRLLQVHVGRSRGNLCLPNRRQMMPARVVWARVDEMTNELICGVEFLVTINACRGAA